MKRSLFLSKSAFYIDFLLGSTHNAGTTEEKIKVPEKFFYTHPVFRYEEFARWRMAQGACSPSAIRKLLFYHTKAGHVLHIRRGVYAFVPPHESPETVMVDPYILGAKLSDDSVLSHHTALELHGVAYSVFSQITFWTAKKVRDFYFQGRLYKPIIIPSILKNNQMLMNLGVDTLDRQGVSIQVTNFARTFVDILDRVELTGGWEEVVRGINNMVTLNIDEVVSYCLCLKNRILVAKVGLFLEKRKGVFAVNDDQLKPLLELKPLSPQYLYEYRCNAYQLVKKWNLMVPINILKQTWEEPNYDL